MSGFNGYGVSSLFDKVYYFLGVNFWFVVSNIPLLLFLVFVGGSRIATFLPLFLLCLLPMAPAFSGVLYAMYRLIKGYDLGSMRDYGRGYKGSFWQSVQIGGIQLFLVFILWTNISFFSDTMPFFPVVIVSVILFVIVLLMTPYLYLLVAHYKMKNMEIIKTALALTIGKPVFTVGNVAALGLLLAAFEISAGTTVLFMGSIYGFLIVFMNDRVLRRFEPEAEAETKEQ